MGHTWLSVIRTRVVSNQGCIFQPHLTVITSQVLYPQSNWGEEIEPLTCTALLTLAFGMPSFTLSTALTENWHAIHRQQKWWGDCDGDRDDHDEGIYLCQERFLWWVPICSCRSLNKHPITSTIVDESCLHPHHCGLYLEMTRWCLNFFPDLHVSLVLQLLFFSSSLQHLPPNIISSFDYQ